MNQQCHQGLSFFSLVLSLTLDDFPCGWNKLTVGLLFHFSNRTSRATKYVNARFSSSLPIPGFTMESHSVFLLCIVDQKS